MRELSVGVTVKNDGEIHNTLSIVPVFSRESYPARKNPLVHVTFITQCNNSNCLLHLRTKKRSSMLDQKFDGNQISSDTF